MNDSSGGSTRGIGGGTQPVRTDDLLGVLNDERRRRLVEYLAGGTHSTSVAELAAALDGDAEGDDTRVALYHVHLPKLADLGVLEFDRRTGSVRYPHDEQLATQLEQAVTALETA